MSRLSWVRGNSVLMTVTLIQKNTDGTEAPIDLSTYDAWACKVWRLSAYKKVETEVVVALDQSGHVVLSIPGTIPCGTYSVEVVCDKELTGGGLANRRSYETPVFAVVESNGEAHITYDVVQCQLSADIEMTFQLTPMATQLGKNAYEMWKELPGHADKTLQEYIDEVLDLNTITAECEAAIVIATHPDYIGEDNYVYHWTNGVYVKTDIYCKGDPGSGGGVQSDWNQSDDTQLDYIKNKPTIPAAQVQSDWNQTITIAKDYIKNKPTIPEEVTERTVSDWGFTKNTGTYSKPSGGIPKTDLASGVQTSLGKADTALQSFTETDPTVPSWAKASSKPSYTAAEVGAVPTSRTVNGKALSSNITLSASDVGAQATLTTQTAYTSKGTATKVPQITTNTLGQVTSITEVTITQPDISGKEDKMSIDSTAKTASFTASVGKYYTVNVANDGSVAVTLPTSGFTTTDIQSIVFLVTLGSGTASCTFSPVAMTAEGTLDASSTYEVNALWNGTGWYVSFVKLIAGS